MESAHHAAMILASQSNRERSSELLHGALDLLPIVSPRSLEHLDKQYVLLQFRGLASMAAATALNAGKDVDHAIQLLELGRAIISGLLLEMRTDISALREQHPELAKEFVSLRDQLDSSANGTGVQTSISKDLAWVLWTTHRFEIETKFNEVTERIRGSAGFRNFLRSPTEDELMAAAKPGPVVLLNASSYRCDAFLIESHRMRLLELPNLCLKDTNEKVQRLGSNPYLYAIPSLLEWLWDVAAGPILETLDFLHSPSHDNWPHVWWIPTGALSRLPFYAAGLHLSGTTKTVLDRVMSSYSPSVKALIYGRQSAPQRHLGDSFHNALLVAMPETPGQKCLPFAIDEVAMVKDLCHSLELAPVEPPQLEKKEILEYLKTCKIFHFAGHGSTDPQEPSRSHLLLNDWKEDPLTMHDLRDCRLQESSPFLSYLSACSTGANKADGLIDEGIHLINACLLAGFRHVVGTLWEVSNKHCVDVAKILYRTLQDEGITDMAVCKGLHRALRTLRDHDNATRKVAGESTMAGRSDAQQVGREIAKQDDDYKRVLQEYGTRSDGSHESLVQDNKAENIAP